MKRLSAAAGSVLCSLRRGPGTPCCQALERATTRQALVVSHAVRVRPQKAAGFRGNLTVIFICQRRGGSRPHSFGHVPVVDALSIHVPMVWSGLKSGLIG
jgi:hypothetical protein